MNKFHKNKIILLNDYFNLLINQCSINFQFIKYLLKK